MSPTPEILEGVSLAPLTTLGIGGPARWFATARSVEDLRELLQLARDRRFAVLVFGGGSNLLVADEGWDGLVVRVAIEGVESDPSAGDAVLVRAGSGEVWDDIVARAVAEGWAGIECLSGIPGLAGATPIQNVGAYGQEVAETIVEVEAVDRVSMDIVRFGSADCRFRYRDSRFKSDEPDRWIVTSVTFSLRRGGWPSIRYADLERAFERSGPQRPHLADVREAVLAIRRSKGMVIDPRDPDSRSAGSFFMNPILTEDDAEAVRRRAPAVGLDPSTVPWWPMGEGNVKLSAAWLIERAGFTKGFVRGNAGLSAKHTLAIVNRGGATAGEVVALALEIHSRVQDLWGVALAIEPRIVGEATLS